MGCRKIFILMKMSAKSWYTKVNLIALRSSHPKVQWVCKDGIHFYFSFLYSEVEL